MLVIRLHAQANLPEIRQALCPAGRLSGIGHRRHDQGHKNADDRDDHQKFNQRKCFTTSPGLCPPTGRSRFTRKVARHRSKLSFPESPRFVCKVLKRQCLCNRIRACHTGPPGGHFQSTPPPYTTTICGGSELGGNQKNVHRHDRKQLTNHAETPARAGGLQHKVRVGLLTPRLGWRAFSFNLFQTLLTEAFALNNGRQSLLVRRRATCQHRVTAAGPFRVRTGIP